MKKIALFTLALFISNAAFAQSDSVTVDPHKKLIDGMTASQILHYRIILDEPTLMFKNSPEGDYVVSKKNEPFPVDAVLNFYGKIYFMRSYNKGTWFIRANDQHLSVDTTKTPTVKF